MTPKYFLLMAGDIYYPEGGTSDWIGCFETYEEAVSKVSTVEHKRTITKGKLKGQEEVTGKSYQIDGKIMIGGKLKIFRFGSKTEPTNDQPVPVQQDSHYGIMLK